MHVTVKASLILAGLVALLSAVVYLSGLHKNFAAGQTVFLAGAIAINVAVVYAALAATAAETGYGGQVLNAAAIGLLGGALVVLVSWLMLAAVFPNALDEVRQGAIDFMEASGMPDEQKQQQLEQIRNATPWSQSLPGGIGTFATSLVAGLVIAAFKRRK
ncbi:MAG: DUF4199 domain-containing protein [Acidobacteria bacterium]|nr:MAG: DUF4199 domain-containing protein [Acidobacteriota bacterium]